jgi:phosphoribosylaminoimidazole-succinocarboxamide synthase
MVLPKGIPYKGQILNQIATKFMELTQDIVPNWLIATQIRVAVGHLCVPFKVEMVIRGYVSVMRLVNMRLVKEKFCRYQCQKDMVTTHSAKKRATYFENATD